jgi:phosphinothricin acetyltransferase
MAVGFNGWRRVVTTACYNFFMTLRDAKPEDLPAIGGILNHEIRSGTATWTEAAKTPEDLAAWLDGRRAAGLPVLVAEADGVVAGYASYGPFRAGEGYRDTVEHSVYIAGGARGQGLASALMAELIARAKAAGLRRMVGGVSADQTATLGLHRKLGFHEQGRLQGVGRKHGRSLDLVLMVLDLDA